VVAAWTPAARQSIPASSIPKTLRMVFSIIDLG
jgi:hypothetical protein